MGMTPTRGLLENRPLLIGMLLFCSYVAVASWLTITQYGTFPHDPLRIFGLPFVVFCCASITYVFLNDGAIRNLTCLLIPLLLCLAQASSHCASPQSKSHQKKDRFAKSLVARIDANLAVSVLRPC